MGPVVAGLGVLASAALIWLRLASLYHRDLAVRLDEVPDEQPAGGWPSAAIVFAARDEESTVERAARSMLAQDYPGVEVVAVDDRSADATGSILDAVAREDPRLEVVHVRELPPGWLGKTHALQAAAEATSAAWLLLTDGDVILEPTALRRAIALAMRLGYDHVTVAPDIPTETESERIFLALFCLLFILHAPPWQVLDRRRKSSVGIGAFNLVRAEAFRAIGGFGHLALSIDDDMRLGEALKCAGYRTGSATGQHMASVRWQVGLGGMIRGLEKNFFAAINFRLYAVIVGVFGILVVGAGPHAGLFVGPWWSRAICALGIVAAASILADARRQNGIAWYHALLLPAGAVACAVALVRSAWLTLRRGGVIWRGRLYPLAELKTHVRRRDAWTHAVWKATR